MTLPKFVLADNSDFPDDLYVIHLEYPRFIIDLNDDSLEFLEEIDPADDAEIEEIMPKLIEEAGAFYEREIEIYENEENED
jgi:hypothetical protein